ncbi:hypothetical protein, partial [Vibrio vulnificus]|uniref:hypothetical protein n=1 Tax=Vibrio vulnificus TaxID=672 RepID=UPI003F510B23
TTNEQEHSANTEAFVQLNSTLLTFSKKQTADQLALPTFCARKGRFKIHCQRQQERETTEVWDTSYNAALRGECRLNLASADHFHHQNSLQTKNATRHESHLNALL